MKLKNIARKGDKVYDDQINCKNCVRKRDNSRKGGSRKSSKSVGLSVGGFINDVELKEFGEEIGLRWPNHQDKKKLWDSLDSLMDGIDTGWVICGDFNEVRDRSDRLNCVFHEARARRFNEFIIRNNLIEIPIVGRKFTRVSDDGSKLSKLDRFFVTDNFITLWKDLSICALDRKELDHCPLLLRDGIIDYGPKPFKIFDEWLFKEGVDRVIIDGWNKDVRCSKKDCIFRDKLKNVKGELKIWSRKEFGNLDEEINVLKNIVATWEQKAENGPLSDSDRLCWLQAHSHQNSGQFTSSGGPIRDSGQPIATVGPLPQPGPDDIPIHIPPYTNDSNRSAYGPAGPDLKILSSEHAILLEHTFSECEMILWLPFMSFGNKLLSNRLRKVIPNLVGFEQSAFIRGRNILDGALIANETVSYLKNNHSKSLIFKVDFEKAFDCLSWDFLMEVMELMGFRAKWRGWILSCLKSASISVLVNGSPTSEFKLERGVRQGDPLSPFLFIIVAEGLNVMTKKAVYKKNFIGVEIGSGKILISHLQYADDTIFFGEWSARNLRNLFKILVL
ncbi:uncharacterized protein [Rutidosis leptorrhynchoides]|uniref:uncharacterized protein n=1 Tax=Rutidosis leptorrhynchoides TaxID=125765 RepID=UPI003A991EE0